MCRMWLLRREWEENYEENWEENSSVVMLSPACSDIFWYRTSRRIITVMTRHTLELWSELPELWESPRSYIWRNFGHELWTKKNGQSQICQNILKIVFRVGKPPLILVLTSPMVEAVLIFADGRKEGRKQVQLYVYRYIWLQYLLFSLG